MKRFCLLIVSIGCLSLTAAAEVRYKEDLFPLIVQDIYEELVEEGLEPDLEELSIELTALGAHPINLNTADEDDLRRLYFLSDKQIDAILLAVYKQPFQSLYELQLVDGIEDYEIRNMLPFVCVEPVAPRQPFYLKEMLHTARHETSIRFDARSIEQNRQDPCYGSLRYRISSGERIEAGIVMERDPQEPLYSPGKTYGADFYGGWLQVQDVWKFKRIVAGDFHATFGQGLALNSSRLYGGKTVWITGAGMREGLRPKRSTAEYGFLRGAGATLRMGITDLTVFYSARKADGKPEGGVFSAIGKTGLHRTENELAGKRGVWEQTAGANLTLRLKTLRLGLTVTEHLLGDTLIPRKTYYNDTYFRGKRQLSAGLNYRWQWRRLTLAGEVSTAQNTRWGWANLTQLRYALTGDISLTAVYRYYSPHFDNLSASSFGAWSRQNDEHGMMVGADIGGVRHWHFLFYTDLCHFSQPKQGSRTPSWAFDGLLQARYTPREALHMEWKLRQTAKRGTARLQLRYALTVKTGSWTLRTLIEGNMANHLAAETKVPSPGGVAAQQAEYSFRRMPLTLQARAEVFYATAYENRIYLYENDVLHAFSIPMLYGSGGRWMVNLRWHISPAVSLYVKAGQTVWTEKWRKQQLLPSPTRTDVHLLLRLKLCGQAE